MPEIIATKFSGLNVTDGAVLPNLLKQISLRINERLGDRTYDTKKCCETVRIKRMVPIITQRKRATFGERGYPRNSATSYQQLYNLNHIKKI